MVDGEDQIGLLDLSDDDDTTPRNGRSQPRRTNISNRRRDRTSPTSSAMALDFPQGRRLTAIRVVFEVIVLFGVVFLVRQLINMRGPPVRGFFCNDDSIRVDRLEEIVTTGELFAYLFFSYAIIVTMVELYRLLVVDPNVHFSEHEVGRPKAWRLFVRLMVFYGYYLIAIGINELLTTTAKNTVGRLRPYFISVCVPNVNLTACYASADYISVYNCTGSNPSAIHQARLSFFSGHSSYSMLASVYGALYLHARFANTIKPMVIVPLAQGLLIATGFFISMSRVVDHNHHPTDVVVGMTVGTLVAFFVATYIARLFDDPYSSSSSSSTESYNSTGAASTTTTSPTTTLPSTA